MWETPVFWASPITVSHTPTFPLQTSVMSYITRVHSTMSRFGMRSLHRLFSHFFWFNLSAFRLAPPPRGMRLPPEGEPCFLHAFTDYSTSVDGILPHNKLLETFLYVSPRISTNWLLPWRYPHGTTRTRPIVHSATYLFQYTIYCPVRGRTVASIAFILFRTEIWFNSTCFVDGDTK